MVMKPYDRVRRSSARRIALGALVSCMALATPAWAEPLTIENTSGETRSSAELNAGTVATVTVKIDSAPTLANQSISLIQKTTKEVFQSTSTDSTGIAVFKNVPSGTFLLQTTTPSVTISEVKVTSATTETSARDSENKESLASSVLVTGASAVAAGVGIALGTSGSSSSSKGSVQTFVDTPAPGVGGGLAAGGLSGSAPGSNGGSFEVSSQISSAPALTAINPAPTSVTTNPTVTSTPQPGQSNPGSNPVPNPSNPPTVVVPPPLSGS